MIPNLQVEERRCWLAILARDAGLVGAFTLVGVFNWLNATTTMSSVQTVSFFVWYVGSWVLWAPVVPPLGVLVRRLVNARAGPLALGGALAGGLVLSWGYRSLAPAVVLLLRSPWRRRAPTAAVPAADRRLALRGHRLPAIAGLLTTAWKPRARRCPRRGWRRSSPAELDGLRASAAPQLTLDALQTTASFIQGGQRRPP
jgi:hypothetical protein